MNRNDISALWSAEVRAFKPAPGEAKRHALRVSSGTSGGGPMLSCGILYPEHMAYRFAGADERTLLCLGSRAARLYNLRGVYLFGGKALALDGEDLAPARAAAVADYMPTRIIGFPSFILRIAALLPPLARNNVRSVYLVGELLSESMDQGLREQFPNARFHLEYAATEVGAVSAPECGHLPRNHFHVRADVHVEIADPDESDVGEIVLTKTYSGVRIENYRTGDRGRLYDRRCPCGESKALALLGRVGSDYIKLAGGMLRVEEFDRAVGGFAGIIQDYRVEAETEVDGTTVRGKVAMTLYCPALPTEALQREIAATVASRVFVTPTRTLAQLAAEGLYAPLSATFTSQPFMHEHKVRKMRYRI